MHPTDSPEEAAAASRDWKAVRDWRSRKQRGRDDRGWLIEGRSEEQGLGLESFEIVAIAERERELGGGVLARGRDFSASRIATRTMAQSGGRKRRGVGERAREGEAGFVNVTLPSQFLYATSEAEEDGEGTRHLSVDPTGRWPEGS